MAVRRFFWLTAGLYWAKKWRFLFDNFMKLAIIQPNSLIFIQMPKMFLEDGENVRNYLSEVCKSPGVMTCVDLVDHDPPYWDPAQVKKVQLMVSTIIGKVNPGACMGTGQKAYIENELHAVGKDPAVVVASGDMEKVVWDRRILEVINGFSLECVNCTNGDCTKRDPDVKPVRWLNQLRERR